MERTTNLHARIAAVAALCCVVGGASPARSADDTALFTARVPPNVMLIIDTSGSMNNVVWHPMYRQGLIYNPALCPDGYVPGDATCTEQYMKYPLCNLSYGQAGFDLGSNDQWSTLGDIAFRTTYGHDVTISGALPAGCVATRNVFNDPDVQAAGNQTRWQLEYLQWYFSQNPDWDPESDGTTIVEEILATTNGATSACLLAEPSPPPATFPKYKRARITAAQQILRDVICQTSQVADIRYGLAKFDSNGTEPAGGYVRLGIADYTTTHRNTLITRIEALEGEAWTPLAETLFNVYRYFMSRTSTLTALGKDGTTRFPVYARNETGGTSSPIPGHPVTNACQKHFVVMITDGEPTKDRFDNGSSSALGTTFSNFDNNLIGHYNTTASGDADEQPPNTYFAPVMDGNSCGGSGGASESCDVGLYLDDVAKFMHENDFALEAAHTGSQTIDSYFVGFTTGGAANTLLQKSADVGGGDFFSSSNPEELTIAITNSINSIIAKSQAFTSAAVPASRTTAGDNFYSAYFLPVLDSPFWAGHLKDFDFSASGEVLTPSGNCAIGVDATAVPPCATTGSLRTSANAFWDAATAMPLPDSRKLYVELGTSGFMAQPATFTVSGTPATQGPAWFGLTTADFTVNPYLSLPLASRTLAIETGALIRYLRGCTFSESSTCTARLAGGTIPEYLGDIFHSNPVVVGSPNSAINEGSYQTFADNFRTRTRVIYAGANDGFLHGFHAGTWTTSFTPPRYDRGTGVELMGMMPSSVRKSIKNFVKFTSGLRTAVNVDGSPVVADVWFNRSGTNLATYISDATAKTDTQWRTVLIQGLRDGGQHYTALDITDPPAAVTTTTTTYPRYLWGFPVEDPVLGFNTGTASETTYMGNTWSEPVITRVRVKVDGGADPRGYERWVAIFGGGYDAAGDPNGTTYKVPGDVGFTPKGRAIYMVEIATGEVLAKKVFNNTATALNASTGEQQGIREMRYAIPSAPGVFDLDFDGFADVIYIGDLGGNMWKWVIKAPGQDPIHNILAANNNVNQPDWPFRLWFRASASTEPPGEMAATPVWNASVQAQSFFFPPTGALRSGTLTLAFGAGERADPIGTAAELTDGCVIPPATNSACANNNHYYVVKDKDPLERVGTLPNRLTGAIVENCTGTCAGEGDLANFDATTPLTCAQMNSTKLGYMITARDGEKFVSNSTIFLGTVFAGSFLPNSPSGNTCDSKGTAFLYGFDLDCGVGEFATGPGSDQDDRRFAVGSGLPTRPRVSVGDLNQGGGGGGGGGDCPNKIVVVTSDGNIYNKCPDDIPTSGINIRSWRER